MQGWLLINLVGGSGAVAGERLESTLRATLETWSKRAGIKENWWGLLQRGISGKARGALVSGCDWLVPAGFRPQDETALNILFLGDAGATPTRQAFAVEAQRLRLAWLASCPDRPLAIHGLLFLSPESDAQTLPLLAALATQQAEVTEARRVWDMLVLVQGVNQTVSHRDGYPYLNDKDGAAALLAACGGHLMVGDSRVPGTLTRLNHPPALVMGACGIFFDWERQQSGLAAQSAEVLWPRMGTGVPAAAVDRDAAKTLVGGQQARFSPSELLKSLANHRHRPRLEFPIGIWQQSQDTDGRFVSPWAFARRALLRAYFRRHLASLPFRASEYAKVFRLSYIARLKEFLAEWQREALRGADEKSGLLGSVDEGVGTILAGRAGPRSLAQVVAYTRVLTEAVAGPADLPSESLFDVDRHLRPFLERAPRTLSEEEEKRLYSALCGAIRAHPVPGALWLQAAALGLVLAVGAPLLAGLFEPLFPILRHAGAHPIPWQLFLGLVPLAIAACRYQFSVLALLRKRLLQYVAAVVRHVQEEATTLAAGAIGDVRAALAQHATEVAARADSIQPTFPAAPESLYPVNDFQRELFDVFQVPPRGVSCQLTRPQDIGVETPQGMRLPAALNPADKDALSASFLDGDSGGVLQRYLTEVGGDSKAYSTNLGASLHAFCRERIERPAGLRVEGHVARDRRFTEILKHLAHPSVEVDIRPISWEWKTQAPDLLQQAGDSTLQVPGDLTGLAGYCSLEHWRDVPAVSRLRGTNIEADEACVSVAGWTRVEGHAEDVGLLHPATDQWATLSGDTRRAAEAIRQQSPGNTPASAGTGPASEDIDPLL